VWSDEPVPITIFGEALRPRQEITEGEVVDAQDCNQWLGVLLKEEPKPSIEVFKAAIDAGDTRDQIKDAKHRIGAVAQKHGFQEGARWTWRLRTASTSEHPFASKGGFRFEGRPILRREDARQMTSLRRIGLPSCR
jgi:hypothetical protein